MNVASLETCQRLYELTKWGENMKADKLDIWGYGDDIKPFIITQETGAIPTQLCPAYNVGFILRKIPKWFDGYYFDLSVDTDGSWIAEYFTNDYTPERPISKYKSVSDTPEDAVCELAIQLIEAGILKKEGDEALHG